MADVFISYSRKDKAFVQRLDAALTERKRDTWVDWEGIHPTEEFMKAIYSAIEGADTFIFILTPDSIASEVCAREIAHATAHNKRMVPIVARDVEAPKVPEPLAKLNWIFCREADAFQPAVDLLVSSLDIDLEWIHAHTRLLARAIEWESKKMNPSFVLRGDDLREAEVWLTQAGRDKERQPTPLQTAYIIASRKAAARGQRITLGAVSMGLIVAVGLAIVAFFARQEANRQKAAAIETLSQADFVQGARQVQDLQGPQALASLARAVRSTGHPSAATRIVSLLTDRVWPRPISVQRLPEAHRGFFSPDGKRSVTVKSNGNATLRDEVTLKVLADLEFPGSVESVTFSPDSQVIMVIGDANAEGRTDEEGAIQPEARMWNATAGQPLGRKMRLESSGSPFFSPDSRYVAVSGSAIRVWDARTGEFLWQAPKGGTEWIQMQFSADGDRLMAWSGMLQVWEARTGKVLPAALKLSPAEASVYPIGVAAFSPDGKWLATGANTPDGEGFGGEERIWSMATGKPVSPALGHVSWVQKIAFNADGRWLLAVGKSEAQVWDAATGTALGLIRHYSGADLTAAAFSPDGRRVVSSATDGSVCVWDAETSAALTETIEAGEAFAAAFTADGQSVVATDEMGTERKTWRILDGVARPLSLPGKALDQHGFLLLSHAPGEEGKSGQLRVWDIRSAKIVFETALTLDAEHGEEITGGFSRDERRIFAAANGQLRLWDVASAKELLTLPYTPAPEIIPMSPDGEKVFTVSGQVTIWNVADGKRLHDLPAKPADGEMAFTGFSPDSSLVVTTASDVKVRLWKVATGAPLGPPLSHPGVTPPTALFSPDGKRLATSSSPDKQLVQLWDVAKGTAIGETIALPGEGIDELEFSPDGRWLVVAAGPARRVYESATGRPVGVPMWHRGNTAPPRFNAGGTSLVTAAESGVRIWDPATGKPLTDSIKAPGLLAAFTNVEFGADRRVVATGTTAPEGLGEILILFDATTMRPLFERKEEQVMGSRTVRFSPDNCLLTLHTNPAQVWDLAPPGKAPGWLPDLAEALGGCHLTDNGVVEILPDRIERIEKLRRQFETLPEEDRWAQIGRWLLAAPTGRTISPYSTVKVSDYVTRRIARGGFASLEEALLAAPADPLARAQYGLAWLKEDGARPLAKERADHETLLATLIGFDQSRTWQARAKVLTSLERPEEAGAAAAKAKAIGK